MVIDETPAEALQQVRLAQAAGAVDEERVVLRAGKFRHVGGGVVGQLVAGAKHIAAQIVAQADRGVHEGRMARVVLVWRCGAAACGGAAGAGLIAQGP